MTVSTADLERVIRRMPMNRGQTTLLKDLYEADGWVPRTELVKEIRRGDSSSFTGVLAALSNRVNSTDGITGAPGYEAFVERRDIDGDEQFRLRTPARRAIERVEELLAAFDRPMGELLDNQGVPVEFESQRLPTALNDAPVDTWTPSTPENRLLAGYHERVGGVVVPEVHVAGTGPGRWPDGTAERRIDGLRFESGYREEITTETAFSQGQLQDIVADRHVEVIEVKQSLGRLVIGQAIAARDLFRREYGPRSVEPVVVAGSGDPAMEWVCRHNGVRVEIIDPVTED